MNISKKMITVIGIGQALRGDDAAGPEAVRLWQQTFPETAASDCLRIQHADMPGPELIDLLANADAVLLVDAVQSGAEPGTLHLVTPQQVTPLNTANGVSYSWGVAETLALARELQYSLPQQIMILGIEAASFQMGTPLSKAVLVSLAKAAEMIEDRIQWWLSA
jgi:hydrogenase maturation protease